jgi:hypothetical protein
MVCPPATSEAGARWPRRGGWRLKKWDLGAISFEKAFSIGNHLDLDATIASWGLAKIRLQLTILVLTMFQSIW